MIEQTKPLSEITNHAIHILCHAIHILCKEIGLVNTTRFINQFTMGYGDYTKERELLFADLTLDEIISEIKQKQQAMRNKG